MSRSLLRDNPEDIDAEWMQEALTLGGQCGSPRIEAIKVENPGTATNAFGSLLRCRLIVRAGSPPAPRTVIVKQPARDRRALQFAKWLSLHKREYDYYRRFAAHTPMRSPSLYYGEFDVRSHRFVLVLEDLRAMDTISQAVGIEGEQARLAVREAARMHGQRWEAVSRPPLSGIYDSLNSGCARILQVAYLACLPSALERFDSLFSPGMRRFVEALGPRITAHFAHVAGGPRTLVHGDYRVENMFFGTGGQSREFVAIDWQGCGSGCGLYDVAYFLATSVPSEARRRMERELLEEYHGIVCRLGADHYRFEDCWRSYRRNMLGALLACILGCGGFDLADHRRRDLATAFLRRTLAAISELDAEEFLPDRERMLKPGYAFSKLSRWGYGAAALTRRLGRRKNSN